MKRMSILLTGTVFSAFLIAGLSISIAFHRDTTASVTTSPVIHQISLLADQATPNAVAVRVGEYVQFNSKDGQLHKIALGSGNAYEGNHAHLTDSTESAVFKADEGYRVLFKAAGTYEFHDHLNPNIFVSVIAYNPTVIH
jgi:plastocyanin